MHFVRFVVIFFPLFDKPSCPGVWKDIKRENHVKLLELEDSQCRGRGIFLNSFF